MVKNVDVEAAVARMRALRSELVDVEAKDARKGLPQRIYESLSAFGNRRGGGLIVMGLHELSAQHRLPAVRDRWRDCAGRWRP